MEAEDLTTMCCVFCRRDPLLVHPALLFGRHNIDNELGPNIQIQCRCEIMHSIFQVSMTW